MRLRRRGGGGDKKKPEKQIFVVEIADFEIMKPNPGAFDKEIFDEQPFPTSKEQEGSPDLNSMQPALKVWGLGKDAIAAICLGLLCFLVLFFTIKDYGITWDEAAPNFIAARKQSEWFRGLGTFEHPFSQETIDQYWSSPSTHPSLTRTLMALSLLAFESQLGEVRAMRIPAIFLSSLLVGVLYFWLCRRINCVVALGAVVTWVTFPRVFGHLHIASLDVPMMVWWALTVIAFYEGANKIMISRWHITTGLLYGLALSTKLHSFFLPIPLVLWMLIHRRWPAWRNLLAMALLGPIVYMSTQLYLWHDFWPRLLERYVTYSSKDQIAPVRIFYFGRQFIESTPWHYPLMILLITIPAVTLFFLILGTIGLYRMNKTTGLRLLILLNILVPASLITLPNAQGYDGIRLILPAMPWLAILGGLGLDRLVEGVRWIFGNPTGRSGKILFLGCFLVLYHPLFRTLEKHHPFQLEYYADWIGGYQGGEKLGMESTYWCNTLWPDLLGRMNDVIPEGASLKTLAMSKEVLEDYQRLGYLKKSIRIDGEPPYNYHLLQCRQGFFGPTEWMFYTERAGIPLGTVTHESVPMYLFFGPLEHPVSN